MLPTLVVNTLITPVSILKIFIQTSRNHAVHFTLLASSVRILESMERGKEGGRGGGVVSQSLPNCCQVLGRLFCNLFKNSAKDFWVKIGLKNGWLSNLTTLSVENSITKSKIWLNLHIYLPKLEFFFYHFCFNLIEVQAKTLSPQKNFPHIFFRTVAEFSTFWQKCYSSSLKYEVK